MQKLDTAQHRLFRSASSKMMESLLKAIHDDDRGEVRDLLKKDPTLAVSLAKEPRLYESKIVHWLYAGDTALHLAAAGHRVEICQMLLAAGAGCTGFCERPGVRGEMAMNGF